MAQALRDPELGQRQLMETVRTLPILIMFHLCVATAISILAGSHIEPQVLHGWQAAVLLSAMLLMLLVYVARKPQGFASFSRVMMIVSPVIGLVLGLTWMIPLLIFADQVPIAVLQVIEIMEATVVAIAMICLIRLPLASLMFYGTVAAGTLWNFHMDATPGHSYLAFGALCAFLLALFSALGLIHGNFITHWRTEKSLLRQTQVVKLLLNDYENASRDWLWEVDNEFRLTHFSDQVVQQAQWSRGELENAAVTEVLGLCAESTRQLVSHMTAGDIVKDLLSNARIGKEERLWSITARPVFSDLGEPLGYRGVAKDVTLAHAQERQLREAKEEAERANLAKSQFLAVISHELRTPINAIVGFTEILSSAQSDFLPAAKRRDYLNTIMESARHLEGLINDVLEATRMERALLNLDEERYDAAEVVEIAMKICRDHALSAKISIIGHVIEDVEITGDITRLKQVILNLLTNAIKFSPEGGIVNVDMQRGPDQQLLIRIRDAGIGISGEDAKRVFEPFVQVENGSDRRFGGMGLGLSIARKIARLHGGDVTLSGDLGIGTEACFSLPSSRVRWPKPSAVRAGAVAA